MSEVRCSTLLFTLVLLNVANTGSAMFSKDHAVKEKPVVSRNAKAQRILSLLSKDGSDTAGVLDDVAKLENVGVKPSPVLHHLDQDSKNDHNPAKMIPVVGFPVLETSIRGNSGWHNAAAMAGIYGIDAMLLMVACWRIVLWWSSSGAAPTGFLGLATFSQVAIVFAFIFLSIAHRFFQGYAGSTGYSIISATILVYVGKIVISLLLFLRNVDVRAGLSTILAPGCTRFGKCPAIILPLIPGVLFAGYDALSFLSLIHLDATTYTIFINMRIIMVGLLWQSMFQRNLSATQWLAFALFMLGGITKGMEHYTASDHGLSSGIQYVLMQTMMSAFANVSSEVLLKEMHMPADLINACTYVWGLIALVISLLYTEGSNALHSQLLSPAAWAKLQTDPYMIGSIVTLIAFGITTAYLLKELSNIVKELSAGVILIVIAVVEAVLHGMISMPGAVGCTLAVFGASAYSTDPLRSKPKELPAEGLQTPAEPSTLTVDDTQTSQSAAIKP